MHLKLGFVSHSTECTEYLVCAGHWLVYEGCKDQSEIVPDMPLHDVHNKYRQGVVGRAGSSVPTVWRSREGVTREDVAFDWVTGG